MLQSVEGRADRPPEAGPARHAHPRRIRPRRVARGARHARPRRPFPVAGVVLVTAVAALGVLWLATHRSVTLIVDGQLSVHQTHAATVGGFLERAGVQVGPDDGVQPEPATALRDGMRVEVVRAREVTLLLGDTRRQVVASALTVGELLGDLGSSATHGEAGTPRRLVRPSRLSRVRHGMVVELTDPVALTVAYDGRREEVVTTEPTVADLLARLGVRPGPGDRVTPGLDEPLADGLVVTVERVDVAVEVREEPVPFEVVETPSPRLPRGERRIARAGSVGRVEVTEEIVVVDGEELERTVVDEEVLVAPVAQVVEVGTLPPAAPPAGASAGGGEADSGEGDGGGAPSVEHGEASWYDNPYGGYTAAHPSLPRGSVVTVVNEANGRSVEVRINDRGPFVPGRVIDLNREAFAQLAPPSRGVIRVRIEW